MIYLFLGGLLFFILWALARWAAHADPKEVARMVRGLGALALLLLAVFLLLRGQIYLSIFFVVNAWWLWFAGRLSFRPFGPRSQGGGRRGEGNTRSAPGSLSLGEARAILGVGPQATADDVHYAYRQLIKVAHPDAGGSTEEAARLNQAKDVLLRHLGET